MLEWIYLLQNRIYFVLFEDIFLLSEKYYSYCGIVTWFIQKKLRTLG